MEESRNSKAKPLALGKTLLELRKKEGLTLMALGEKCGIPFRTIEAIEKGRIQNPSFAKLSAITRSLNLTLWEFFRMLESKTVFPRYSGDAQGKVVLELPKKGIKIISYTPLLESLFCGKIFLEAHHALENISEKCSCSIFMQVIFGKLEAQIGPEHFYLKEGNTLFFVSQDAHRITNSSSKTASLIWISTPNFLSKYS